MSQTMKISQKFRKYFLRFTISIFMGLICLIPSLLFSADITLIASLSGDKQTGKFNQPVSLFFDESKKRLYIADTGNNRLISFDSEFNYISESKEMRRLLPVSAIESLFFDSSKNRD